MVAIAHTPPPPVTHPDPRLAPDLRARLTSVLSVFDARDHADSALAVVGYMLNQLPEVWTAEPKFAVMVARLAGVEMKVAVDEVEAAVTAHAGSGPTAGPGAVSPAQVRACGHVWRVLCRLPTGRWHWRERLRVQAAATTPSTPPPHTHTLLVHS